MEDLAWEMTECEGQIEAHRYSFFMIKQSRQNVAN